MKFTFGILFLALLLSFQSSAQSAKTVSIKIDLKHKAQRIDNFGAAGAWFSEGVAKYWPTENREKMAQWLFSKELDAAGNPKGIGLSAWRFNIGGGTAEQGDSSGIVDFRRRAEGFLNSDGSYDWTKQSGYLWFTKKAQYYGVENLIAFSNTPPVQFTENGLGYKTVKDFKSNLRADQYENYARFLTDVLTHFKKDNLAFDYISPVNEPQWDWYHPYGKGNQEGTPWKNEEIAKVNKVLDAALTKAGLATKILTTEAGQLDFLYGKTGHANRQTQAFFDQKSDLSLNGLSHLPKIIGGHSYFTDKGDSSRIAIREHVADTTKKYGVDFWQTEYSMLGAGYKEGKTGPIPAIDCALFLSKVIHDDLVYGNACAWQLWNSWEPGKADFDTRYYVIALSPSNKEFTDGTVTETKNLWALGHYSRFVRPGMSRIVVVRNDGLSKVERAQDLMVSAFANEKQVVLVAVNYSSEPRIMQPEGDFVKKKGSFSTYLTSADTAVNMQRTIIKRGNSTITVPARSMMTIVYDL